MQKIQENGRQFRHLQKSFGTHGCGSSTLMNTIEIVIKTQETKTIRDHDDHKA